MMRRIPGHVVAIIVGLLLFVFIAYPLGSVLVEGFRLSGPMTVFELRKMTVECVGVD